MEKVVGSKAKSQGVRQRQPGIAERRGAGRGCSRGCRCQQSRGFGVGRGPARPAPRPARPLSAPGAALEAEGDIW